MNMKKVRLYVILTYAVVGFVPAAVTAFFVFWFIAALGLSNQATAAGLKAAGMFGGVGLVAGLFGTWIKSSALAIGLGTSISAMASPLYLGLALSSIDHLFKYIRTNIPLRNRLSVEMVYSDEWVTAIALPLLSLIITIGLTLIFSIPSWRDKKPDIANDLLRIS
jgi:hypothetical protein